MKMEQSVPKRRYINFTRRGITQKETYNTIKLVTSFVNDLSLCKIFDVHEIIIFEAELFPRPYLLTYLLTPCSRVLLEKLTGSQLVKKFPAFYGTRRFITAFTSARHLSLPRARSIQSTPPHPTY
jgi:hypothetical protein